MNSEAKIRAFLVDDEQLALKRLESMLLETGRVDVVSSTADPINAFKILSDSMPDVLFLDIKMPGLTGFELLEKLDAHPPVIFTTAYDEHSLNAFDYFSVDYLLKPIERSRLDLALDKLDRISGQGQGQIGELVRRLRNESVDGPLRRISSRTGSKVQIIDVDEVTHFYSEDKLTFASTVSGELRPIDKTLNSLEAGLDPGRFQRIHRSTIVNLEFVGEVHGWFSGGVMVRLNDKQRTDLSVARSRVRKLKKKLGMK